MVAVRQSTILRVAIDDVWRILRDFNSHQLWHPAIAESEIEKGLAADAVGAVRRFRLQDGSVLREQLLALSDANYTLTYCLLEAPLPLMNYVATIKLLPVTEDGGTFWQWYSAFSPPQQQREEMIRLVEQDIYQAGFAALQKYLAAPVEPKVRMSKGASSRDTSSDLTDNFAPHQYARPEQPAMLATAGESVATAAVLVEQYGGPEVLQLRQITVPPPAPDQVQIRQSFIGVNFIDIYCRSGHFDLLTPPDIPGMEAAGIITAVGANVAGFLPGERVAYACPPVGAYTGVRNMQAESLVKLPPGISEETAATVLLKGITASFLLHEVHQIQPGEAVLVYAAAGGVGQLLLQWLVYLGAHTIAVVSTEEKAEIARQLGADSVLIYSRDRATSLILDTVAQLTDGRGVDVIYDAVGASTFTTSLAALAVRGHLVSYGEASGPLGQHDIGGFAAKSITLSRPNYAHYNDTPDKLQKQVARLFSVLRTGAVQHAPPTHYPLSEAGQAHSDLEQRRTTGSVLLLP